jgi:DNA repair exonuclease SbcCD ATPase subunit
LNNFLSYEHAEFRGLDSEGLTLIEGRNIDEGDSNGSGKSSLFDAISWCLFGQTSRGTKADDVINRKIKRGCGVSVAVDDMVISRYRKHEKYGDRLIVLDGDTTVELGTLAQTQDWILQKLGIDFELFRCTVLFAQGETFNFVNSGNKAQKEILSKVMRVSYDDHLKAAKHTLSILESKLTSNAAKISILESHVIDEKSLYVEEIESWDREREKEILKQKSDLDKVMAEISVLTEEADDSKIEKLVNLRDKVREKISKLNESHETAMGDASEISGEMGFIKKEIAKIDSLDGVAKCPTCLQNTKSEDLHNCKLDYLRKLEEMSKTRASSLAKADEIKKSLEDLKSKDDKLSDAISEARGKKVWLESSSRSLATIEKSIKSKRAEINPYIQMRQDAIDKQKQIATKIEELKLDSAAASEDLPFYRFWVNGFGDAGIKSFVFDLICSTLTSKANRFLNILSGGSVTISFDTQKKTKAGDVREKFDCNIVSGGQTCSYDSYSGGEKRRISLAVDMALSELMAEYSGTKFNMVTFDEQDSFLDNQGRQNYMNLLRDLAKSKKVFVVAHDDNFKSMFDDVITIEKRDGLSRIV